MSKTKKEQTTKESIQTDNNTVSTIDGLLSISAGTTEWVTEPGLEVLAQKNTIIPDTPSPEKEPPVGLSPVVETDTAAPAPSKDNVLVEESKVRSELAQKADGSIETRVIEFLTKRGTGGFLKINDFLKSLYPLPKNNEPVEWQKQTVMKSLRAILDGMVVKRQITMSNNSYLQLGKPYWPDDTTGKTHYHHLGTVSIEAKLI